MLLMVENGIRERICHSIYRYAKASNKCLEKITAFFKRYVSIIL